MLPSLSFKNTIEFNSLLPFLPARFGHLRLNLAVVSSSLFKNFIEFSDSIVFLLAVHSRTSVDLLPWRRAWLLLPRTTASTRLSLSKPCQSLAQSLQVNFLRFDCQIACLNHFFQPLNFSISFLNLVLQVFNCSLHQLLNFNFALNHLLALVLCILLRSAQRCFCLLQLGILRSRLFFSNNDFSVLLL